MPNHNQLNNLDSREQQVNDLEQKKARIQNELGSKVLTLVGFESKHKEIVDSSFNKARKSHEKAPW